MRRLLDERKDGAAPPNDVSKNGIEAVTIDEAMKCGTIARSWLKTSSHRLSLLPT